jgi:ribonuclease P protein component
VDPDRSTEPPKIGFIVSRAVGSAVVRNRVRRRLRELMRSYLQLLPGGSLLVVRANPVAARVDQSDLAADLDLVIGKLLRRQVGAGVDNARLRRDKRRFRAANHGAGSAAYAAYFWLPAICEPAAGRTLPVRAVM